MDNGAVAKNKKSKFGLHCLCYHNYAICEIFHVNLGNIVTNLAAICTQQPESPQFSYFNKSVFIVRVPSLCLMGD